MTLLINPLRAHITLALTIIPIRLVEQLVGDSVGISGDSNQSYREDVTSVRESSLGESFTFRSLSTAP